MADKVAFAAFVQTQGRQPATVTKTGNYTVTVNDEVIVADASGGSITITLLAANAAGAGFSPRIRIKRKDSTVANTVTVARAGADTIDGATSLILEPLGSVDLDSDGVSLWSVCGRTLGIVTNSAVEKNGNQTSFVGNVKVTGWTVDNDPLSEWDAVNNRFSIKYAGTYRVYASMKLSNTAANIAAGMLILKNAATTVASSANTSTPTAGQFAGCHCFSEGVVLAAGDTIELDVNADANTTVNSGLSTRLCIARVK